MLNVLLDVNILGKGFGAEVSRAGIFRATESLIRAMLRRPDATVSFAAEASWVSELLLLSYDRESRGVTGGRVLRAWTQPAADDLEATALINRIVAAEAAGVDARRDRATLTLLNATARRLTVLGPFDVVHSLRTPLAARERVAARVRVLTIADVIPLLHPEWMYDSAESEVRAIVASVSVDRDYVIAHSLAAARDVSAVLRMPLDRIFVTPLAADPAIFHPETDLERIARVRARYGIAPGEYVLSLCTLEPRKNLPHLIGCFYRLLAQEKLAHVQLVLVGATGWKADAVFAAIERHHDLRSRVVLTGYVPDEDLAALYSGARVFAYPSLYEGFGLPVLEAMRCGTPVITSDTTSLPEVTGDAAVCVSPTDSDALCEVLLQLLTDDRRARELRLSGLQRSQLFSWDMTAELTLNAYEVMLASG